MKTTTKLERTAHTDKDRQGKYRATAKCDGCNKPVGTNYFSDEDVCGSGDGPGFYVCDRKRCAAKLEGLGVEQRRAVYETNRNGRG
jgi:hypothetical protein